MADISITAGSVVPGTNAQVSRAIAGATITAGQTVYIDTTASNVLKLADANSSSLTATVAGIAVCGGAAGQYVTYQTSGRLTLGGTITAGGVYVASSTAGGVAPVADLASGWRTSTIGIGLSTTVLDVRIHNSDTVI